MPIKVTCQCGQSFAAKDELGGKTVKCPKCQKPLKIPAAAKPAPAMAAPATASRPAAPAQRPAPAPAPQPGLGAPLPSGAGSLFDEVGLNQQAAGATPCPGCGASLPPNVILCVKCGYNKRLGRRMETVRMGAVSLEGGHESTASELMEKAARTIEEDAEEERKKTKEGMPWWAYLIALGCVVGFMITMMLLPPQVAIRTGGVMMWLLSGGVSFYAGIRILIIAFSEGIGHGVGCLICGLYELYFIFSRWDQCGGYFLMALAANVVGGLVQGALMYVELEEEEDAMLTPPPPPAAVARAEASWHLELTRA